MKKILALLAIIALLFTGCCTKTVINPDGTAGTSKSFLNCITTAQDKVCNAPPAVMNIAQGVITLAEAILAVAVPGSSVYIAAVGSLSTAQGIQATGCAILTDLAAMIQFAQNPPKASLKKAMAPIDVQPLIDWGQGK